MSTKTTKRKRAAPTPAAEATPPAPADTLAAAPVDVVASVVAEPEVSAGSVEPIAHIEIPAVESAPALPTVGLESNHTVKDAAVLKNSLLQVLDEPGQVTIDAKSVERIDTAIIHVLCAFVRDRAARGLTVSWGNPTQAFLDAARLLGVSAMLALPVAAGAAK